MHKFTGLRLKLYLLNCLFEPLGEEMATPNRLQQLNSTYVPWVLNGCRTGPRSQVRTLALRPTPTRDKTQCNSGSRGTPELLRPHPYPTPSSLNCGSAGCGSRACGGGTWRLRHLKGLARMCFRIDCGGGQDAWALTASPAPQGGQTPLQRALMDYFPYFPNKNVAKMLREAGARE